jgi:GT2 family glycosyltransferase
MAGGGFLKLRGITFHEGEGDEDGPKYSQDKYCDYAPTCFMLINNKLFDEIGIMDEKYFVYFDDTDFIYRAFLKGYRILMMHHLHVLHKVSSSTGGSESPFSIYYGNRNRVYFIRKNFKKVDYLKALTFTILTRFLKHIQYNAVQKEKMWKGLADGFKL